MVRYFRFTNICHCNFICSFLQKSQQCSDRETGAHHTFRSCETSPRISSQTTDLSNNWSTMEDNTGRSWQNFVLSFSPKMIRNNISLNKLGAVSNSCKLLIFIPLFFSFCLIHLILYSTLIPMWSSRYQRREYREKLQCCFTIFVSGADSVIL